MVGYNPLPLLPSTFQPNYVPNCVLWLRADLGITQSGGVVSNWADQSGSGYNFTATLTARPAYTASGINSLPTLTFDGALTSMGMTGFTLAQPYTVFMVIKLVSGTSLYPTALSDTSGNLVVSSFGANQRNIYIGGTQIVSYGHLDTGVPELISFIGNGATNSQVPIGHAPQIGGVVAVGTKLYVGAFTTSGAQYIWRGQISEILVYSTALTSYNANTVTQYLCSRYNLP